MFQSNPPFLPSLLKFILSPLCQHYPLPFFPLCISVKSFSFSMPLFFSFTFSMHRTLFATESLLQITPCFTVISLPRFPLPLPAPPLPLSSMHLDTLFSFLLSLQDEPSSGMDPRTKRHLWKIISEEVKGKCAVVLTSHRLEDYQMSTPATDCIYKYKKTAMIGIFL